MENNQMKMLYEALLCSPGMNENVKVDLRISRKQILLLSQVMESGIATQKTEATGMLAAMPEQASTELSDIMKECIDKANLTDLNEKLKFLSGQKK